MIKKYIVFICPLLEVVMSQAKSDANSMKAEDLDELLHRVHVEQQENDIGFMTSVFESEEGCYKSAEDMYACQAQDQIISAKQKIRELQEEIEKQEAIICGSEKTFQKYKRLHVEKTNKRGRPVRSEDRERIARNFISQWVESLKEVLQAKSCGKLEELVSATSERNWRRWLNGDAIPNYTTFEKLLSAKITSGKFAGEPLYKVPVTPEHSALLGLLRFI